jgi:2-polyprenyl-3-methyl-5-hydroxy-6-metoxy-1,4-benzoquinol methylase
MTSHFKVVADPRYGYRRIDPIPTPQELESFYKTRYYSLLKAGGRAPELKRILEGGESARGELEWLAGTLWTDIHETMTELLHPQAKEGACVLDYGCGPGHFSGYLMKQGWRVEGVEIAEDAAAMARAEGLSVYDSIATIPDRQGRYNAIVSLNVLEHVPEPMEVLIELRQVLKPGGFVVIRVPNDFSPLQEIAQKQLGTDPWWVAIPDHINYFNFESLERLLKAAGFDVVDQFGDFPMEMFLLFGDVYVGNPELGSQCHGRRRKFELALPSKLRRELYRKLASCGIGRDQLVFAQLPKA